MSKGASFPLVRKSVNAFNAAALETGGTDARLAGFGRGEGFGRQGSSLGGKGPRLRSRGASAGLLPVTGPCGHHGPRPRRLCPSHTSDTACSYPLGVGRVAVEGEATAGRVSVRAGCPGVCAHRGRL